MNNFVFRINFENRSLTVFNEAVDVENDCVIESLSSETILSENEIKMLISRLQGCLKIIEEGKVFLGGEMLDSETMNLV